MSLTKIIWVFYLFVLFTIPCVLVWLPPDFFDEGESICISVLLLDTSCYGCGMTRALQHLIHLQPQAAITYNKLALVVLPLLIAIWLAEVKKSIKKLKN